MFQKSFSLLFFLFTSLFADEGISQASAYRKNSDIQWQLAMEGLDTFHFDKNDQVLDVGCGDGKITAYLSTQVPEGAVVGLDISEQMIVEATSHFAQKNLSFLKGSAEAIPFRGRFDKVVSFTALHWFLEQRKALQSMKESLKPGGTMLLVLPVKSANNLGIREKMVRSDKWSSYFPSFKQPRVYYTPEEYKQLLHETGLEIEDFKVFQGIAHYKDREALVEWMTPCVNFIGHLPEHLQKEFIEEMTDEVLLNEPPNSDGSITLHFCTMRIIANKGS
jgi:trans-aconitate 2-methyltransferase